jgi:acetolactate synthase-1/2/3 large subunit
MYNSMNLLLDFLAAEGVEYVFGVPGGSIAEFMRAAAQSERLKFIVARHETGGSFMADGYARVSRRLGVCVSTTGPGATNMLTGVAVANADGIPMLALSGYTARGDVGKGALQETSSRALDMAQIFRSATRFSEMVPDVKAMRTTLSAALRACWSGARGAAYLGVPTDVSAAAIDPDAAPGSTNRYRGAGRVMDRQAVAQCAEILAKAKRPALFVGSGARQLEHPELLTRLAERLGAAVTTTLKGKNVFPEVHPLSMRNFGTAACLWAYDWFTDPSVDVLFVIGSSLGDWATGAWNKALLSGKTIIQLDIDPDRVARSTFVDHVVIGHVEETLQALHAELDRYPISIGTLETRRSLIAHFKKTHPRADNIDAETSEAVPLKPQRLVHELEEALPDDAILFIDSGNSTFWTLHHLTLKPKQEWHLGASLLSMGYSFVASIGGKVAAPDRPVIAIGGDGALLMNGNELHTAVQYNVPVVWICFYDQKLGTVYHGNQMLIGSSIYSELAPFDPVMYARSFGADGVLVERPGELTEAVQKAIASKRPTLIAVAIDADELPPFAARINSLKQQMQVGDFGR